MIEIESMEAIGCNDCKNKNRCKDWSRDILCTDFQPKEEKLKNDEI